MTKRTLASQTQQSIGVSASLRTGVVRAVTTSGAVTLAVNGATVGPVPTLGSYVPKVGDSVSFIVQDQQWLVLGPATSAQAATAPLTSWQSATLLNGFTNRGAGWVKAGWRLTAEQELRVVGEIVSGATTTSGTQLWQLPSTVWPVAGLSFPVVVQTGVTALCEVETDGRVRLFGSWAVSNIVAIDGLIPLTAPSG